MDYRAIFEVSAAGMGLEKKRLEVAALNLANINTTAPAGSEGYRPLRVVAHSVGAQFSDLMNAEAATLSADNLHSVSVEAVSTAPRLVQEPGHPHADAQGFVRYPAVDQSTEMITALTAMRAYEANVAAVGMARAMTSRALEIGGQR
jgi:flagellar basal-body rod protein FlgC